MADKIDLARFTRTALDISTAHLAGEASMLRLTEAADRDPYSYSTEYGVLLFLHADRGSDERPDWYAELPEIRPIADFAIEHGFVWLNLDSDADECHLFPTFDWAACEGGSQ